MRVPDRRPSLPPWPREAFPPHLDEARRRSADRLLAGIGADGALRDPCRSRVLESALCLRLLDYTGSPHPARARLKSYLESHRDCAEPLDRLMTIAALSGSVQIGMGGTVLEGFLARAPRFTSARKKVMVDAILSLFGVAPQVPDPTAFSTGGLHSWAVAQVTSLKVIMDRALGRPEQITAGEVDLLLSTQNRSEVWEGNILIHLSALNALAGLPGMAETVERGVRAVLNHQRADGGLPFITDTDTWCTATAGVALLAAGAPREYLHRLAGHLVRQQRENGGWAYTDVALQTDVDDISVAVEFLHTLDPVRYQTTIDAALNHLRQIRGGMGGFPTYVREAPPEACMTAAAVNALGVDRERNAKIIGEGLGFIAAAQHPDGSFDPDWSASVFHTVFRAVLATGQHDAPEPGIAELIRDRALGLVRRSQNPDGGWGWGPGHPSDAVSTSYALIALCAQADVEPAARAAEFILGCQNGDGSISSVSDSIGPRPFIFTVPALADIFSTLALGHLSSRLAQASAESPESSELLLTPFALR